MFKFELDQTIYYMHDNRMYSAPVLARMIVENLREDKMSTTEQIRLFQPFGPAREVYKTVHGPIHHDEAFESPASLAMHITGVDINV